MAGFMRAQAGKVGDDLAQRHVLHSQTALLAHLVEALAGGVGRFLLAAVHVDGRRADDGVAVDGRRDEHALAELARQLEDRVVHMAAGRAVQQEVIAAARGDRHAVVRDHVVDHVGVHARRVHDDLRLQVALVGMHNPAALNLRQARNDGVKLELDAVLRRILRQREGQAKRADDAAGRRVQRSDRVVADVRLHGHQLVALDDAQSLDAVLHAVLVQLHQVRAILLAEHDDEAAVLDVMEVQLLGQPGHDAAAFDIQLRHQAAVRRIVAGVNDGAVGLGGAAADVLLALDHEHIGLLARQLAGNRAAGNASADNDDIRHVHYSFALGIIAMIVFSYPFSAAVSQAGQPLPQRSALSVSP